jgi:HK97 family phage prohead protease
MRINKDSAATGPLFITASIDDDSIDEETRSVDFVASDESVDRYGDIVKADWNLHAFKKNPVFLWNHDHSIPAIGGIKPVGVENRKLMVTANFTQAGINPFSDQLFRLVKAKVLRAVSVGFRVDPQDVELIRDKKDEWTGGYKYNNPELLELSLCNVGANAHALAVARSLGVPSAFIGRALVSDALVKQQQCKTFRELLGARIRAAKIYGPR